MQTLLLLLALAVTIAAPYTLVSAIPRLSQAVASAIALSVPIALAFRYTGPPPLEPSRWFTEFDAVLLSAMLIALALAVFVRLVSALIGERARAPGARIAINVLGLAIVGGALPWLAELIGRLQQR